MLYEAQDADKRIIITYYWHEQAEFAIVVALAMESTNMFLCSEMGEERAGKE